MDENTIRKLISEKTGIPTELLYGNDPDEILTYSRHLIDFKEKHGLESTKNTRDQFANWLDEICGIKKPNEIESAYNAIDEISESLRLSRGGYPNVKDGGTPYINGREQPDPRPTREQFADWIAPKMALDFRKENGWIELF